MSDQALLGAHPTRHSRRAWTLLLGMLATLASLSVTLAATEGPASALPAATAAATDVAVTVRSPIQPALLGPTSAVRPNAASDYFKCITGIGVPLAAAIIFVAYMTYGAFVTWMNTQVAKANPGGPPGPLSWVQKQFVQRYAKPVAASCGRFLRS